MKQYKLYYKLIKSSLFISIMIIFVSCYDEQNNITDCDGYIGKVTNKSAETLIARCHFMPKDSIVSWTNRYQKNKKDIGTTSLPIPNVLGDSCSFNNSIVKAIITNDSCIGLRVVNGMDIKNKVHLLLVGIKPDYTTLYIRKPKDCDVKDLLNKKETGKLDEPEDDLGGGEMSLEP